MILTIQSHVRENEGYWGYLGLFLGSDAGLQGPDERFRFPWDG